MAILGTFHKNRMCEREKTSQLIYFSDTCDSYGKCLKLGYIIYVLYIFGKHKTRQKRGNKNIQGGPFKKCKFALFLENR